MTAAQKAELRLQVRTDFVPNPAAGNGIFGCRDRAPKTVAKMCERLQRQKSEKRVARNARRNARFGVALETRAMSLDVPQRRTVQLHLPGGDIAELPIIEQMYAQHQKNK